MKTNFISITMICAALAHTDTEAALIWSWDISNPVQVVSVTDPIMFLATLYNDRTSTEHLYGAYNRENGYWVSNASCCNASLNAQYVLNNPGVGGDVRQEPNFISQFYELDLAPGETFEFVFLNLTPRYGTVESGRYDFNARLGISNSTSGALPELRYSASNPSIIVSEVPLPAAGPLFASALLTLLLRVGRQVRAGSSGVVA